MIARLCLLSLALAFSLRADSEVLGQGEFRYRVVPDWGREALAKVQVKNGHAVAVDASGRLFFLTDDARNNVIILDAQSGALIRHWTARMPGAHGLTLVQEKDREVLFITDTVLHEARKMTLDGEELARYPWPQSSGLYQKPDEYRPSKILNHPDGRLWIFDGYGKDYIHEYQPDGSYRRSWGGNLGTGENQLIHWGPHGGGLDLRNPAAPVIIVAMSDQQEMKRFDLAGQFLSKHAFPGGNPRDFVPFGDHALVPHLGDQWPKDRNAPGFISVVDRDLKIISNIGAPPAEYVAGQLQSMRSDGKTFIHPHGVAIDAAGNLFVAQFASPAAPLLKLERLK